MRFKDLTETFVIVGRAVLGPIMKKNALKIFVLVGKYFSLELVGPVPTRDEFLTTVTSIGVSVIGICDIAGLGLVNKRSVIVTSDIEMFSPSIDGISPRISSGGEAGNNLKAMGSWVKAVDSIVLTAARSVDGLHLSMMKHALLHVEPSTWPPDKVVDCVVAIFAAKAVQEDGLLIGLTVAVGIPEENKIRLLRKVDPVLAKLEAKWEVKILGKDGAFVGFAVLICVLENKNLIVGFDAGKGVRIGRHGRNPKTSSTIKFESNWIPKLRKFLLRGEEFDLKPLGNLELGSFFYGRKCRRCASSFAWLSFRNLDSGRIIDLSGKLVAASCAPDPLVPKTGHLEKLFTFERKVD